MSACLVCPDRIGDGWKKPGVTHCPRCHTSWSMGTKITHCVSCHETFSTHANSDRHQAGTKSDPGWRCRLPASVGLVLDERGIWRMPGREETEIDSARFETVERPPTAPVPLGLSCGYTVTSSADADGVPAPNETSGAG